MSDEAAFLAAVIASPDDDLPRLVFADWLDENGEPERAEFIRRQIERHRLGDKAGQLMADDPIVRLFKAHQDEWLADFPSTLNLRAAHGHFKRGFLTVLRVSASKFARIPKRVWARHPIEEVHLDEVRGRLGRVFARPEMNRIRRLTFHADGYGQELTADDLRALAGCPHLTGLRELTARTRSGNPLADALARCPSLGGLESLSLGDHGIDADGVATLARSANLRHLTRLWLGLPHMSERAIGILAACPALAGLKELSLRGGKIGDDGAAALARSPHFTNLRRLWLNSQNIGPSGAAALGQSPHLANLRSVRLDQNAIGPAGVRAIVTGTWTAVEELELDHCSLGDEEAAALAERGTLTALTELDLSYNRIGQAGATALSKAKWLCRLTTLDLKNNPIGDEGALALCGSKALANLKALRVESPIRSPFSPAVVKQLKARFGKDVVS